MSKLNITSALAVLMVAGGCAAPLRPSCAPPTPAVAAEGENAARGPLWDLAQCACRGKFAPQMVREATWPFSLFGGPKVPENYVQSWGNSETDGFWAGKHHIEVRQVYIPRDQCADGRPVEDRPIALTLARIHTWFLGTPLAVLTASDLNAHPSYKFSTSPEGNLRQAWRVEFSAGRGAWLPADITDPEIRTAFEAEKRFWLAQLGQVPPGPPPVSAAPSQ